jgi:hypothetical protein
MKQPLWWGATFAVLVGASALQAADRFEIKGKDGTLEAQVIICNDCRTENAEEGACHNGAEKGWYDGTPCGACLMEVNYGAVVPFSSDLRIIGKLVDGEAKPVGERFVKLFMPTGWGSRSRTSKDGVFRLLLGATMDREEKRTAIVDVGTQVDSRRDEDPHFALFLLPATYKPCESAADSKGSK